MLCRAYQALGELIWHARNFLRFIPARRINEIVHGKRSITADTALRLARYFGMSERFWINLQFRYDLEVEKDKLGQRLEKEVHPVAQAG